MAFQTAWMNKRSEDYSGDDRSTQGGARGCAQNGPTVAHVGAAFERVVLDLVSWCNGRGLSDAALLPKVTANIVGLGGLPPVTRDGFFVLVLIVGDPVHRHETGGVSHIFGDEGIPPNASPKQRLISRSGRIDSVKHHARRGHRVRSSPRNLAQVGTTSYSGLLCIPIG